MSENRGAPEESAASPAPIPSALPPRRERLRERGSQRLAVSGFVGNSGDAFELLQGVVLGTRPDCDVEKSSRPVERVALRRNLRGSRQRRQPISWRLAASDLPLV